MTRPRAEDFLEPIERLRRGRPKVYVGFAAGLGKTHRMLEGAHAQAKRGADVVVGLVETHGLVDTPALVHGLEVVPRRVLGYRTLCVEEMALDALVAQRPAIVLFDEVARSHVPASRHTRRCDDVCAQLDAGINVICAFTIHHLESLKDMIEGATSVAICERVSDTFLEQADQVVNLDLAVEDLLERLRAGRIYVPEKVTRALENFFQEDTLSTLREIAESVGRAALARASTADGVPGATQRGSDSVMVCFASRSQAGALVARGWQATSTPTGTSSTWRCRASFRSGPIRLASASRSRRSRRCASWAPRWCGSAVEMSWRRCSSSRGRHRRRRGVHTLGHAENEVAPRPVEPAQPRHLLERHGQLDRAPFEAQINRSQLETARPERERQQAAVDDLVDLARHQFEPTHLAPTAGMLS